MSNYFAPTDKAKQEGYNAYLTDKNAERLATALCRMRGAALKLGQMLSIQDEGVLPPQVPLLTIPHALLLVSLVLLGTSSFWLRWAALCCAVLHRAVLCCHMFAGYVHC